MPAFAQDPLVCSAWAQLKSADRVAAAQNATAKALAAVEPIVEDLDNDRETRDSLRTCLTAREAALVSKLDDLCRSQPDADRSLFQGVIESFVTLCTNELIPLLQQPSQK